LSEMRNSARAVGASRLGGYAASSVVVAWILICLAPLGWMVLQSFKRSRDTFAIPPTWFTDLGLQSYHDLFAEYPQFTRFLVTSLLVAGGTVVVSLVVGLPASYVLTFLKVKRRGMWLATVLLMALLPPVALLVPLFEIWTNLNLLNSEIALILTYSAFNIPFVIWMLRGFMQDVPPDIYEAALVDGASHVQILLRIVAPLVRAGCATVGIFVAIFAWNELLYSIILTTTRRTATGGLVATLFTDRVYGWGKVYAGGTLVVIPIVLFATAVQKQFVRGLTFGAVKS